MCLCMCVCAYVYVYVCVCMCACVIVYVQYWKTVTQTTIVREVGLVVILQLVQFE